MAVGFDELGSAGRRAVLAGTHEIEAPPDEDGLRWGPSAILRPDEDALARIDAWTSILLPIVGPGHWATGATPTAHITVRTLNGRGSKGLTNSLIDRYRAAVAQAARSVGLVQFRAGQVLLSPISVMLSLTPVDDSADRLASELAQALGADGWFEKDRVRDIWYVNLIHFTGPIANSDGLIRWVDSFDPEVEAVVRARSLEVVRWDFDLERMSRSRLAHAELH